VIALVASSCLAQQTNVGGITGTVRDASGAVIPGTSIEAVNQGTNLTQTVVTNTSGTYTITLLPVGHYIVTATKQGFQKSVQADIPVLSGETFTVDFKLNVGQITQLVTVTGLAPVLDTTTANQGTTRSLQEIAQLPIPLSGNAARGAVALVQSLSGVNYEAGQSGNQVWTVISRAQIDGVMPGTVGYQIDGIDAGMGEGESAEDFGHPNPEQIEEVRLATSTDASMGFNGGVTIALTTKSGTNQVHGDVYYYNRNAALEARQFFLPDVGKDNQNEGGVAVGGPVYIPHVYDGRNRTFFFGTFSSYRFANNVAFGGTSAATVPTMLERQGNFTELLGTQLGTDALGRPIYEGEIYDPATTRQLPDGTFIRDPFTYQGQLNVIDPTRFSSISTFFQDGYKPPTSNGTQLNWRGFPYPAYLGDQRYYVKIDHTITSKQRVSFSLQKPNSWGFPEAKGPHGIGRGHFDLVSSSGYLEPVVGNGFFVNLGEDRYMFNYVWTLKPNALLNFRAGMTRVPKRSIEPYPDEALLHGAVSAGLKGTQSEETPYVNVQGVSSFGPYYNIDYWTPQKNAVSADLRLMKGNHNIDFGGQYIGEFDSYYDAISAQGTFNFRNNETGFPGFTTTGAGYASFLLGEVDSATVPYPYTSRSATGGIGLFIQDTWRATSKLTINYGLRWDLFLPLHVRHDEMSSFDPTLPNPGAGGRLGALSIYGVGPGRNGLSTTAEYYHKAFAPKLGFAYSINPKTVFRASYGVSYLPYYQKYAGDVSAKVPSDGFTATRTAASVDNGVTPAFNWNGGFPLTFPPFPILDPALDNGGGIGFIDRNDNRPEMAQNIGAELGRELPGKVSLRVGYVGTMAHRLETTYNMNALPLSAFKYGNLLLSNITDPPAQAAGIPLPYPGFAGSVAQALLPYPQYLTVTNTGAQVGNSVYHALQINVQRQFGSLVFLANFTASKQLCNVFFGGATGFPLNNAQHPALMNDAKALCGYPGEGLAGDKPKILNFSWVWNVPIGSKKRYLSGAKGALNQIVGGWTVTANQTYQSGSTLRVTSDQTIPGLGAVWPVLVPGVPVKAVGGCGDIDAGNPSSRYLNLNAFRDAAPFSLGNVSMLPTARRCGFLNEDSEFKRQFHSGSLAGSSWARMPKTYSTAITGRT
jgi:hypothetical protein